MNKLVLCLVLAVTFGAVVGGPSNEENNLDKECRKDLTPEEGKKVDSNIKLGNTPSDMKVKCYWACFFEKTSLIVNGKLVSVGNSTKENEAEKKSPPGREKRINQFKTCSEKVTVTEKCEMAYQVIECMGASQ